MFDPVPDAHPRLLVWARWFREAGFTSREVARLFNKDLGTLIEAGMEP